MLISKSNYLSYLECDRLFYLQKNKQEEGHIDPSILRKMKQGHEVGLLARSLFEHIEEVAYDADLSKMVEQTNKLLNKGVSIIAEASFQFRNLFCSVDILSKEEDGFIIYEVKSSTKVKPKHIDDVAFQTYVLTNLGFQVKKVCLIHINKSYRRGDTLDIQSLFQIEDVTIKAKEKVDLLKNDLKKIEKIVDEPPYTYKSHCNRCSFQDYCYQFLPDDSIVHLYYFRKKEKYFLNGYRQFKDLPKDGLTDIQIRQIDHHYHERGLYVNHEKLGVFLNRITYPIYFLDFETLDHPIPKFNGVKANQRLPYQASLHILRNEKSSLEHIDILIEPEMDPREKMAVFLEKNIESGTVLVYNDVFEKSIIQDLIDQIDVSQTSLIKIKKQIIDLLDVFKEGMVYNQEMNGSFSIKKVYPALLPQHKDTYKNLDGIHDGKEAMLGLESLNTLNGQDKQNRINQLKAYCKLDTLSMVEIYQKLKTLIKE